VAAISTTRQHSPIPARKTRKRPVPALNQDAMAEKIQNALRKLAAYRAMSVPDKLAYKKRELAELMAELAAYDQRNPLGWRTLRCRHLEIDIEELEGMPEEYIKPARWEADEYFRTRGHPRLNVPIEPRPPPAVSSADASQPIDDELPPPRQLERGIILEPAPDRLRAYRERGERWEPSRV